MRILLAGFAAILVVSAFTTTAKADYFVWQDAKTGLSLSYPDTWRQVSHRHPDEIFTIIAPSSEGDDAVCRVRAREDRRFLVYPPHLAPDVQKIAYSKDFWDAYLGEYDNVDFYGYMDGAGLGRGFGSFAVAGYDAALFSPYGDRRGIAGVSLYNDKAYVVDCSARTTAFSKWQPLFLSIIGSVDFKKTHDELWSGDYRNFSGDPLMEMKVPGSSAVTRY